MLLNCVETSSTPIVNGPLMSGVADGVRARVIHLARQDPGTNHANQLIAGR